MTGGEEHDCCKDWTAEAQGLVPGTIGSLIITVCFLIQAPSTVGSEKYHKHRTSTGM